MKKKKQLLLQTACLSFTLFIQVPVWFYFNLGVKLLLSKSASWEDWTFDPPCWQDQHCSTTELNRLHIYVRICLNYKSSSYYPAFKLTQTQEDFGDAIDFSTFCGAEPDTGAAVMCPGYLGSPMVCTSTLVDPPSNATTWVLAGFQSYTYVCNTPGNYQLNRTSEAMLQVPT